MTIEEFIADRIGEMEAVAQDATDDGHDWLVEEETISLWPDDREPCDGFMSFPRKAHARHVALHSPKRVLRQVAAMRRAIDTARSANTPPCGYYRTEPDRELWEDLGPIAAIWSDHSDFRPEWSTGTAGSTE